MLEELTSWIEDGDNIICPICDEVMTKHPTMCGFVCSNNHIVGYKTLVCGET